jgi:hypothetical protein
LNDDLPYDEFLIAQIAGDQVATDENPEPLAALGYLTLGRRFLNNQHDIIDDRLDVVFRGMQALTVQCARCHDHKYDPIPTADYYSLYGVFASSEEPSEKPLLGTNPDRVASAAYETERDKRVNELEEFRTTKTAETLDRLRAQVGDHLLCAQETMEGSGDDLEKLARERKMDPGLVRLWQEQLKQWQEPDKRHPAFVPWQTLAALSPDTLEAQAGEALAALASLEIPVSSLVLDAFSDVSKIKTLQDVAEIYNGLFKSVDEAWKDKTATRESADTNVTAITAFDDPDKEQLRQILYGNESPIVRVTSQLRRFFDVPTAQRLRALQRKVEELEATHPGAPPRAMAMVDKREPVEPVIFRRGSPGNRGDTVPRQFLSLFEEKQQPFTKGSGRHELALAIANRDNPLTARVMVNRVWLQYFGVPLVHTPSDFGLRSEPPTHPELLDALALFFMDSGWSLKALHREILLSATYQMASDPHASGSKHDPMFATMQANHEKDPQNHQYWRMNRKRADFEALRDSLLSVSGALDATIGGRPVDIYNDNPAPRRTLYGFIDRQNLPGLLRSFDFASPDTSSPMRFQTTVPQQALFMINSRFVQDRARDLAQRTASKSLTDADRIDALYQLAFQRPATTQERQLAFTFLVQQARVVPLLPTASDWQYGLASWDNDQERVVNFRPFTVYKERRWQASDEYPSQNAASYGALNAKGGHPGRDKEHAVTRRWTAPISGTYSVQGELHHPGKEGDGVRARVVSQKHGVLDTWTAKHARVATVIESVTVEKGEVLDFLVDCWENENTDSFEWAPTLTLTELNQSSLAVPGRQWSAAADFQGPTPVVQPLDEWEKFAQVLLASNEFTFID